MHSLYTTALPPPPPPPHPSVPTILLPCSAILSSKLSSVSSEAEKLFPMSRNVGMPPVRSALRRLMVMVGTSAVNLRAREEEGPCSEGGTCRR